MGWNVQNISMVHLKCMSFKSIKYALSFTDIFCLNKSNNLKSIIIVQDGC